MPYCNEFVELFENEIFDEYPLFTELGLDKNLVLDKLKSTDHSSLCTWIDELCEDFLSKKDNIKPFHLGLGNPNSDILFVGHEIAININAPNPAQLQETQCATEYYYKKLFVNEAILNYFLWYCKILGIVIKPNCCVQNPEFASAFCHLYNTEKPGGHYWANINKILNGECNLKRVNNIVVGDECNFKTKTYLHSFMYKCFLTELNNIPSPRSPLNVNPTTIADKINDITSLPFFRKFGKIVFACHTYIQNDLSLLMTDYGVTLREKQISTNIRYIYEGNNKKIIVCNNLSGAAGWSNIELNRLANELA